MATGCYDLRIRITGTLQQVANAVLQQDAEVSSEERQQVLRSFLVSPDYLESDSAATVKASPPGRGEDP